MMKKAVMNAPGELVFKEYPIQEPGRGEVLIKIKAVGICTWEQGFYNGMSKGFPFIGGHEICGKVVSIGAEVAQNLEIGDTVVVASLTRCGECWYCRRGMDNMCSNAMESTAPGEAWGPGGFSEYFIARGYEVYKVNSSLEYPVGTLAEPLACVIRSMDRSRLEWGDTAVILGAGVMGLLHLMLAKDKGAKVIISEPDAARRKKALELGAEVIVDPFTENLNEIVLSQTENRGAEAVFFTAGGTPALSQGITLLNKNGTLVVYGAIKPSKEISLDPMLLHYDEIYLTGVTKHTKDTFRRAAELISSGRLPLEELISGTYPFEKIKEAFEEGSSMSSYRIVLEMQD
jgi:2-desacetyl-2-hydroxyethyl bacteriochlorophyllide A dehydrogenase